MIGPVARVLRSGLRTYQLARAGRPSPCRFTPSCSTYAIESLEVHGARGGSWLALRRVVRCRPGGAHGWDPVPLSPPPPAAGRPDPVPPLCPPPSAAAGRSGPGPHLHTPPTLADRAT